MKILILKTLKKFKFKFKSGQKTPTFGEKKKVIITKISTTFDFFSQKNKSCCSRCFHMESPVCKTAPATPRLVIIVKENMLFPRAIFAITLSHVRYVWMFGESLSLGAGSQQDFMAQWRASSFMAKDPSFKVKKVLEIKSQPPRKYQYFSEESSQWCI